jgi:hypothetical protein
MPWEHWALAGNSGELPLGWDFGCQILVFLFKWVYDAYQGDGAVDVAAVSSHYLPCPKEF